MIDPNLATERERFAMNAAKDFAIAIIAATRFGIHDKEVIDSAVGMAIDLSNRFYDFPSSSQ